MPAPIQGHISMATAAEKRFVQIFNVVRVDKEYPLVQPTGNLLMSKIRVDMLIWLIHDARMYRVPVEIETQEQNMDQIEKNICKCVDFLGTVVIVCKTGMVSKINELLRVMPAKYRDNTFVISYSLIQNNTAENRRFIIDGVINTNINIGSR